MADIFFFTDVDLLNAQTAEQAYGPAGTSDGKDKFRITSIHTATATPKAYAICDGVVCIQQDKENDSLVNLILKPTQQPSINTSKIKYIIYKGLKKNSILASNNTVLEDSTNNLTKSVYVSWNAYLTCNKDASGVPSSKLLGFDLIETVTGFEDTATIDSLFYRDESTFQYPVVKGGWTIGKFDETKFGIEIITDDISSEPTLSLARNVENFISVAELSGSENDAIVFKHWHDKETILYFIDPCAFYGSLYVCDIRVKKSTEDFKKSTKNEIYDVVLKGAQHTTLTNGNFYNRNTVYLDIRNEHNQSLNYYKNYGVNILISLLKDETEESLEVVNYYRSNWPILLLTNFETGNTSSSNTINISLPVGDNKNPLLYISQGYAKKHNPFKKQLVDKKKFIDLTPNFEYTSEFVLSTPNREDISETTPISCIIKLRYFKRLINTNAQTLPVSSETTIRSSYFLDAIFPMNKMSIPFKGDSQTKFRIYDEEVYIDRLSDKGIDFVAAMGIAEDIDKITFFVYAKDHYHTKDLFRKKNKISFSSGYSDAETFLNYIEEKNDKIVLSGETLPITETSNLQLVSFIAKQSFLMRKIDFMDYENEFFAVVINKEDFESLKSIALAENLAHFSTTYKHYLGLINKQKILNEATKKQFFSFDIAIKSFLVGTSGAIEAVEYTPKNEENVPFKFFN